MASKTFDFSDISEEKEEQKPKGLAGKEAFSYGLYDQDSSVADENHPILIIEDKSGTLVHHVSGRFYRFDEKMSFEYGRSSDQLFAAIHAVDSRFIKLIAYLADNHEDVRLSGHVVDGCYNVYKIRAVDAAGLRRLTSEDGFLQNVIQRLLASKPPKPEKKEDDAIEEKSVAEDLRMTDVTGMENFLKVASSVLPDNIATWAKRNLMMARSQSISPDERRHAMRALSMMLNIHWRDAYFPAIDPVEARRVLDESLYGMDRVKQRIIETIIQINRTHTLPAYGLLLCGPAGVGKSQIAYAVARILKLPWTALDMSTINDAEALTGSPRVYSNAKPGKIMEAFSEAGSSNLVFIINELDKAEAGKSGMSPADALLTLLDNLGFTDNYVECTIPTNGVYPIATANDKSRISDPLMTRFAVIDIDDYTADEKKMIFERFSLPKVLKRMQIRPEECVITDEGAKKIVEIYKDQPGVRDLEQAAEHLAAHALYIIETEHKSSVTYDAMDVEKILTEY
ncbi:MAG: AAA family ATPase [Lachnospiraceae bacterium]|nr:AAA family ATPase [Lachnospiraceae bacterium]